MIVRMGRVCKLSGWVWLAVGDKLAGKGSGREWMQPSAALLMHAGYVMKGPQFQQPTMIDVYTIQCNILMMYS